MKNPSYGGHTHTVTRTQSKIYKEEKNIYDSLIQKKRSNDKTFGTTSFCTYLIPIAWREREKSIV